MELPAAAAPGPRPGGPLLLVAAHEAVPGLALQAAHARATLPVRAVRRVVPSEVFVQGWAAYAEDLVAGNGAGDGTGEPADESVLRLHLLHRRLLATIDAVLDVRVHAEQLPQADALRLLTERGHLDDAAAAATWRPCCSGRHWRPPRTRATTPCATC